MPAVVIPTTLSITGCPRCNQDHSLLVWIPVPDSTGTFPIGQMPNPSNNFVLTAYQSTCPITQQTLIMRVGLQITW